MGGGGRLHPVILPRPLLHGSAIDENNEHLND